MSGIKTQFAPGTGSPKLQDVHSCPQIWWSTSMAYIQKENIFVVFMNLSLGKGLPLLQKVTQFHRNREVIISVRYLHCDAGVKL